MEALGDMIAANFDALVRIGKLSAIPQYSESQINIIPAG